MFRVLLASVTFAAGMAVAGCMVTELFWDITLKPLPLRNFIVHVPSGVGYLVGLVLLIRELFKEIIH